MFKLYHYITLLLREVLSKHIYVCYCQMDATESPDMHCIGGGLAEYYIPIPWVCYSQICNIDLV